MALHMAPDALLRCDDEVLDHLVVLAGRQRTEQLWALEAQALTAELTHAVWRLTVQVNSKKGTRPPAPLNLPRPWRNDAPARGPQRLSVGELIERMGPRG